MDPSPPHAAPHALLHTRDLDVTRTGLQSLYGDVRADVAGPFEWRARTARLGPLTVVLGFCNAPARIEGVPVAHVLNFTRAGAVRTGVVRASAYTTPGGVGAVFSPGEGVEWASEGVIESVNVCIDPRFLAAQFEALCGEAAPGALRFAHELPTNTGAGAYVDRLCQFFAGEVDRGTTFDHPAVMTGLAESLVRALLVGHAHDHAHLLEGPPPPSSRTVVRLAEEFIDAQAGEPIGVVDFAAATGAPARSLEAAFRLHRGTTPAAFLGARRLEHARRMLLHEVRVPVPSVAHAAGFLRPEVFAAAYAKTFHETPEDTRRQGLLAAGAPRPEPVPAALASRLALLSVREREVCVRAARGMLNKQIGADLGITERTVKEHRGRAMRKLGLGSAAELGKLFR